MQPAARLCQDTDDDVEETGTSEPRGIDGRSHVRFGLGRPHGAMVIGDIALDQAGVDLAVGDGVRDLGLAWLIAKRQKLRSGPSGLGLQVSGEVASGGRGQHADDLLLQRLLFPRKRRHRKIDNDFSLMRLVS